MCIHWDVTMSRAITGAVIAARPRPRLVTMSPAAVTAASTHEASITMLGPESSVPAVAAD